MRLVDDLKGIVKGEILFDELSRALYSTDASIFQVTPLAVVVPEDEEDVRALVGYAAANGVALIPRGAGSGLAGEALGHGIIVDLSRHFRSIRQIGADTVCVQPGVVLRQLNQQLAAVGRRFAPDPAAAAQCTIGGMLATNASGPRALKHGYTRDHVASLRVVLNTGDAAVAGREPLAPSADARGRRFAEIVHAVAELLRRNLELIEACQPRSRFNRLGYLLHDVLGEDYVDVAKLLVGSEGTLGIFTEATLRTVPLPASRALLLYGFPSLDAALRAALRTLPLRPSACELIDRRLLTLARGSDAEVGALIPTAAEAALLIEFESDEPEGAQAHARELTARLGSAEQAILLAEPAFDAESIERLWRVREAVLPGLYGMRGGVQPVAFVEDVAVPPEELPVFLHRSQEILQRHETIASFLAHAGTGQVHVRPFLDLRERDQVKKLWSLGEEIHRLALDLGGTVSSQHGTGLARTPWVARQYGRLYPVFRELKEIFDPRRIFNPGKIVGPEPGSVVWPLRRWATAGGGAPEGGDAAAGGAPGPWRLRWPPDAVLHECHSCNGCGDCRTEAPGQRMCPLFRATHAEAATPRAKANLMRHLLSQARAGRRLTADDVRAVADLCINCKMCARECAAHVNVPKLMLEAKAAHAAEHGLDRTNWVLARSESFAALASSFAVLFNVGLASRSVRWLMEKFFGISRHRRLPPFAPRSFLRLAGRRGWTLPPRRGRGGPRPRVAYFVDVFANYNDPTIGEATVALLHHHGIDVYVPPGQWGSGLTPLAVGDVEAAREIAQRNVRILANLAREGYRILCSEPSAALMLRHDYLDLLDDPDAQLVAEQTVELTTFLDELHRQGKLRTDFPVRLDLPIGYHIPCHLKALGPTPAGPKLLALIPGLRVDKIDVSCSGMAGTFGLKAETYRVSLEAGRPMLDLLRRPRILFGASECSACRLQMEEGSGKRTLHPVQYLAIAYGFLPELLRRLQRPTLPRSLP
ncbi:MAG: FAD-binding protein [Gemmataceae bacterium]|nr:FAD-binding protein [Gemmataceae bacterium]MDW8264271.1 FAD-linked oxidase C-terminal domain-containing protein [Gemmataceae bacterium]